MQRANHCSAIICSQVFMPLLMLYFMLYFFIFLFCYGALFLQTLAINDKMFKDISNRNKGYFVGTILNFSTFFSLSKIFIDIHENIN